MGSVYRVYDKQIAGEVALKLIRPEIAADKKTIERFRNELKITRMISHKNVCRMFDLGEEKGTHFITMEYVPGEDLKSMIRMSGQLSVGTAIKIAKQVCEGLAEAHRLGIVHRDLKPSNIIIDKNGDARIMDFGIARSLGAKGMTAQGMMIGTPDYISPEQVEGKETDPRSDIYSLGVSLYEMVTGNLPFEGETPLSLAIKHKTEPPPDPRRQNDQIPQSFSRLISRCLAKDKDKRFQTADELLAGLNEIEKEIPMRELRHPAGKPFSKPFLSKLRKKKIIEIIAAFIAGGGFLLEFVHWTLIDHYHLPERIFDVTLVTLIGTLIFILIWRWFEGKESPRKFKKELILLPLVALLTILIDVNLVLRLKPPESGPSRAPEPAILSEGGRKSIAVMYSVNNSGDIGLNRLRWDITELLSIALAQSKYLRVFPSDGIMKILQDLKKEDINQHSSEILNTIAKVENIDYFVLPSYSRAGDNFWINIQIRRARVKVIEDAATVQSSGPEKLLNMVDELARKVKAKFDLTSSEIADDYDQDLGKIATSSLDALRFYVEGKRHYIKGKYKESIEALERATASDPGFALAYSKIADNYYYLGFPDKARQYIEKALSLINRVSERDRYLIQGYSASTLNDSPREAIASYQKLLSLYPNDEEGYELLGALYRNLEEWDLAAEQFEKMLRIDPRAELAYENLALIYMAMGLYDKARDLLLSNQYLFPNFATFPFYLSLIFLYQNNSDRVFQELDKLAALAPESNGYLEHIGNIYFLRGDFAQAEKLYHQLLAKEDPDARYLGRSALSLLYLAQGEFKKSKNEILQGLAQAQKTKKDVDIFDLGICLAYLNLQSGSFAEAATAADMAGQIASEILFGYQQMTALHFRGLAYLGMNKLDRAKKMAEELDRLIKKTGLPKEKRRYYHLVGSIALKKGLTREALDSFERALALLPHQAEKYDEHAFYLSPLASAHYQMGNLEKAQEQYEKIVSLTTGRLRWGDIYSRSFYWLGKIQEKKGFMSQAAESYRQFLRLWENADHWLQEKEDAKKQLALLK
jgi:tetratricopeptide (TPR) repeat protein/predicted Ser/Thr protein kinase